MLVSLREVTTCLLPLATSDYWVGSAPKVIFWREGVNLLPSVEVLVRQGGEAGSRKADLKSSRSQPKNLIYRPLLKISFNLCECTTLSQ